MTFFLTRLAARAVLAAALAAASLSAAHAHSGLVLHDPFARMTPQAGAVYVHIMNHADDDDRLIGGSSPQADMVMVMTTEVKDGVSSMQDAPDGLPIAAYDTLLLAPGGNHVMLMGLKGKYRDGDLIEVTLNFEQSGSVTLTVPVMNTRSEPPQDVKTPYDAMTSVHSHGAEPATGAMSMAPSDDEQAIIALMKAQFDKPEAPLTVDPVVVMGDAAIASWAQGDMAGRALLQRGEQGWVIRLCAGPELRDPAFLQAQGIAGADHLSMMFNSAEDRLGADKVTLFSGFEGVVDMSKPASN